MTRITLIANSHLPNSKAPFWPVWFNPINIAGTIILRQTKLRK